jgi:hypothetical protein
MLPSGRGIGMRNLTRNPFGTMTHGMNMYTTDNLGWESSFTRKYDSKPELEVDELYDISLSFCEKLQRLV